MLPSMLQLLNIMADLDESVSISPSRMKLRMLALEAILPLEDVQQRHRCTMSTCFIKQTTKMTKEVRRDMQVAEGHDCHCRCLGLPDWRNVTTQSHENSFIGN